MARAEQLADLFQFAGKFGPGGNPDTKGPVGFHQGQITFWDPVSGRNSVRVLGTIVNDLPMLSMADSILLTEGDTVAVLRFRQTYFLLGRIVPPGGGDRPVFQHEWATASGFAGPGSYVPIVEVVFDVPLWASRAIVTATTQGAINNTSGGLANLQALAAIAGSGGGHPQAVPAGYWQSLNYARSQAVDVTPGGTVDAAFAAAVDWPAHSGNFVELTATAIFGNT